MPSSTDCRARGIVQAAVASLASIAVLACACSTEPARAPVASSAPAPRPVLSAEGQRAYRCLATARRFTDAAIYEGGDTPKEVIALRILWREPHADVALRALLDEATLPGRLFALCGLYYSDRAAFLREIEPYRRSRDVVEFQTGCERLTDQPVAELVECTRGGAVRLERVDQTNREWIEQHAPQGGARYDILGGGYPNVFRADGGWGTVRAQTLDEGVD